MRITARWTDSSGKRGRMPGTFSTATEAEDAARQFMAEYPTVTLVSVSHETGGWLTDVSRDGHSSHGWRATTQQTSVPPTARDFFAGIDPSRRPYIPELDGADDDDEAHAAPVGEPGAEAGNGQARA
ncbi:hypothetical protein K388_07428 [Streptomyces sp. KhCrAH-43]|uniref:hypothetical protein n=1 Tax=unclassified Streptomyces TaxID=2593676 RepID=UPI0003674708|nr:MULTISPECIES: hypothetical protein [unclassified Streptomyces]MYS37168.1 hypothetical protein [Streptomyces sp. SID4920]MYX67181.1 hypothetical protein [Streptomyces sp. SID8373]RAJ43500.1 hypothetical protein K388_07428 [Streptomyces sp. KhCrAH-43]